MLRYFQQIRVLGEIFISVARLGVERLRYPPSFFLILGGGLNLLFQYGSRATHLVVVTSLSEEERFFKDFVETRLPRIMRNPLTISA
jgi:hypothetical protein